MSIQISPNLENFQFTVSASDPSGSLKNPNGDAKHYNTSTGFYWRWEISTQTWVGIPKMYRALISQNTTSAPIVTILENTIGSIVWSRDSAGIYTGTLSSTFTANKTFCQITNHADNTYPTIFQNE